MKEIEPYFFKTDFWFIDEETGELKLKSDAPKKVVESFEDFFNSNDATRL